MRVGLPEIFILIVVSAVWVVPVVAGAWALWTLHRIKTAQTSLQARLDAIERRLSSTSHEGE